MNGPHLNTPPAQLRRRRMWTVTLSGNLLLVLMVALVTGLLALGGDGARELLRYQREAIINQHQWWRLVTGHLVHGDAHHWQLNVAGLALIAALCRRCFQWREWLFILLVVVACIDVGFLWWMPQLQWYVGLSGVMHGVLAAGAWRWWQIEPRPLAALLTLILAGKLLIEQTQGALPLSGEMPVVINAHWYGALGGTLAAVLWQMHRWLVRADAVT